MTVRFNPAPSALGGRLLAAGACGTAAGYPAPGVFESLTSRLGSVFERLRGRGRLGEADVDAALREVRLALLEADVNVGVTRSFLERVRARAVGRRGGGQPHPGPAGGQDRPRGADHHPGARGGARWPRPGCPRSGS